MFECGLVSWCFVLKIVPGLLNGCVALWSSAGSSFVGRAPCLGLPTVGKKRRWRERLTPKAKVPAARSFLPGESESPYHRAGPALSTRHGPHRTSILLEGHGGLPIARPSFLWHPDSPLREAADCACSRTGGSAWPRAGQGSGVYPRMIKSALITHWCLLLGHRRIQPISPCIWWP